MKNYYLIDKFSTTKSVMKPTTLVISEINSLLK